jgi:hypothetical protein
LRSSLNMSDQVSHPYTTTGKIIDMYILIIKYLDTKLEDVRFCTEWKQALPAFNLLLISSWIDIKSRLKSGNACLTYTKCKGALLYCKTGYVNCQDKHKIS